MKEESMFRLCLPDRAVRGMNRQQYKRASHWIRLCSRQLHARMNWDVIFKSLADVMLYGYSEIHSEDLIKS